LIARRANLSQAAVQPNDCERKVMSDKPAADWDPRDESVVRNQRLAYDEMRERCPVAHSDYLGWSLFRHSDIMDVLSNPETYSNRSRHRAIPNGLDAPEHTTYRRMIEPFFAAGTMATLEPECRTIASEMVRELTTDRDSSIDLVAEFAEPYPLKVLCAFLGWPSERWERLRGWNHGNQQMAFSQDRAAGKTLAADFTGYVEEELRAHRDAEPSAGNDVTTRLMKTEVEGAPLSDEDVVSILRNWTAGHGTVAAGLANVMLYLAQHPNAQDQLRRDPAKIPAAIEELLRVNDPLVMNRRTTTRDIEIGGRKIGQGERLTLMWVAANRDGRIFDNPDEVRFDRDQSDNLVFGWGIHDCVGAPMARLELRVGIETLLAGTSRIELDDTRPPEPAVVPSNGLESLHVRLFG
jgi:cytochrome P450